MVFQLCWQHEWQAVEVCSIVPRSVPPVKNKKILITDRCQLAVPFRAVSFCHLLVSGESHPGYLWSCLSLSSSDHFLSGRWRQHSFSMSDGDSTDWCISIDTLLKTKLRYCNSVCYHLWCLDSTFWCPQTCVWQTSQLFNLQISFAKLRVIKRVLIAFCCSNF